MRRVLVGLVAVVLVVLAVVQVADDALFGDLAAAGTVPRALAATIGPRLARAIAPAVGFVNADLVAADVRAGRLAAADARVAALPAGPTRDELRGRIAQARGERVAAIDAYLRAGDVEAIEPDVDAIDATGDYRAAGVLQRKIVARLRDDPARSDAYARSLWRLGQLDAEAGYREPPQRLVHMRRALRDYQAALDLAPLSETYLLAAANQALFLGDLTLARAYFARALTVDPRGEDARRGLERVERDGESGRGA